MILYTKKIIVILILAGFIFFLKSVFKGNIILPQTFSLGFFTIHYYGLTMALAISFASFWALARAPKYNINVTIAEDLIFWLILGGFFGARLYHVFSLGNFYLQHPIEALKIWHGGLSIFGALIGGVVTLFLYKKFRTNFLSQNVNHSSLTTYNLQLSAIFNWLTPSIILGQIIGRFGNFFNYEAFGYPTNLPWKMFVSGNFRPTEFLSNNFFHPWFLYEQIGNLIILWIILYLEKTDYLKKQQILYLFYILLYNVLRFGLEFLRIDSTFVSGLRQNAVVSLFLALISLTIILKRSVIKNVQVS